MNVAIVTFVPTTHADAVRAALGNAGAGVMGEYSNCSYTVLGKGRYKASTDAQPFIGTAGSSEEVEEERIEVLCDRSIAKQAIRAMKDAHPYEEVAYYVYPLLEESEL